MKGVILILCVILGCTYVNGGQLLAVQSFGAGYPSFHLIKVNDDGIIDKSGGRGIFLMKFC